MAKVFLVGGTPQLKYNPKSSKHHVCHTTCFGVYLQVVLRGLPRPWDCSSVSFGVQLRSRDQVLASYRAPQVESLKNVFGAPYHCTMGLIYMHTK